MKEKTTKFKMILSKIKNRIFQYDVAYYIAFIMHMFTNIIFGYLFMVIGIKGLDRLINLQPTTEELTINILVFLSWYIISISISTTLKITQGKSVKNDLLNFHKIFIFNIPIFLSILGLFNIVDGNVTFNFIIFGLLIFFYGSSIIFKRFYDYFDRKRIEELTVEVETATPKIFRDPYIAHKTTSLGIMKLKEKQRETKIVPQKQEVKKHSHKRNKRKRNKKRK